MRAGCRAGSPHRLGWTQRPVTLLELPARAAWAWVVPPDLAPTGRIVGVALHASGGGDWPERARRTRAGRSHGAALGHPPAPVGLLPTRSRCVGVGPDQKRMNRRGQLLVVLDRHIQRDSVGMVHVV